MAALLESEIIKGKPIGKGLAAFHDAFRSTCADLGVPASAESVHQIIDKGKRSNMLQTPQMMAVETPHLRVSPDDITIIKPLGGGDASEVFKAKIASFADGKAVALKVFKAHNFGKYNYTFSKATGLPLSPFDRELLAYSVIQGDDEAKVNLPVIQAYGWFEIPAHFRNGRFQLSGNHSLKVIVKEYAEPPHFNFNLVDLQQMIEHRNILNRLQVYDMDIKSDNFLRGRLADLSATYVLSHISHPEIYNLEDQYPRLKEAILRDQGIFSFARRQSVECVEQEWQALREKFTRIEASS